MSVLSDYFSPYEQQIFLGHRTSVERVELLAIVEAMTARERTNFKRRLWATHRQRIEATRSRAHGHSAVGSILAELSREKRGEK